MSRLQIQTNRCLLLAQLPTTLTPTQRGIQNIATRKLEAIVHPQNSFRCLHIPLHIPTKISNVVSEIRIKPIHIVFGVKSIRQIIRIDGSHQAVHRLAVQTPIDGRCTHAQIPVLAHFTHRNTTLNVQTTDHLLGKSKTIFNVTLLIARKSLDRPLVVDVVFQAHTLHGIVNPNLPLLITPKQNPRSKLIVKRPHRDVQFINRFTHLPKANAMIGVGILGIQQRRIVERIVSNNERITLHPILHKQPRIRAGRVLFIYLGIRSDAVVTQILLIVHQQITRKLSFVRILGLARNHTRCSHKGKQNQGVEMSHSLQRNKKARIFVVTICQKSSLHPPPQPLESSTSKAMDVP